MGALNMGLTEEELPEIVSAWRAANPRIKDLWYSIEQAAFNQQLLIPFQAFVQMPFGDLFSAMNTTLSAVLNL